MRGRPLVFARRLVAPSRRGDGPSSPRRHGPGVGRRDDDIRSRYVLSYTPKGVDRSGWHELDVDLRDTRGDVLARPAYFRPPRDTAR